MNSVLASPFERTQTPRKFLYHLRDKEQVERENISRRRYPDKWGKLAEKDVNRFYNQSEVNKIIRGTAGSDCKETWPYAYTGRGDSYFMSKDMYESLVAKCRCGRRLTEGHAIKCLQRAVNTYLKSDGSECSARGPSSASSASSAALVASGVGGVSCDGVYGKYHNDGGSDHSMDGLKSRRRIPETTSGMIGWVSSRYSEWERSAKYVSPAATMVGHRVAAHPYSVVFVG